jgi:hypothetical protein
VTDHRALADRLVATYLELTHPDAALLGGSVASGETDEHSDVDLLLYYDELPGDEDVEAARERLGGTDLRWIAPRSEEGLLEQFVVDGIHCQIGHLAVAALEADVARLVSDPDRYLMKGFGGLHDGLALHGSERIDAWRAASAYGDELQRAVILRHWKVFPLWRQHDALAARDAALFRQQILVDGAFDLLAVLAAANRVWFSSFQLKRTRKLIAKLEHAPPRLAERLEGLVCLESRAAADELKRLAEETHAIVAAVRPDLELPPVS